MKFAWYFAVVVLLFVLAEHLGRTRERTDTNLGPDSTTLVSLTVSLPERSGNGARFPRAVPPKQQEEPFHLLSGRHSNQCTGRTTCRAGIPVIGMDELIRHLETASPHIAGIDGLESHVDQDAPGAVG